MAHQLEIKDGQASFFTSDGKPAWHGLGRVLNNPLTAEEAIKEANLGFIVAKAPVQYTVADGLYNAKGEFVTYRTDNNAKLGVVGSSYQPLQNHEAFNFFDALVEENEAIYHTAGVLDNGRRVWVLAKFPQNVVINGVDEIEQYCLLYNSHDGSSGAVALLTDVRVCCNNTLNAAINGANNKVVIRHTKNVVENLKAAHKILGLHNVYADVMTEAYNALAAKQVNETFIEDFFSQMYPRKEETKGTTNGDRIREAVLESFESSPGSELVSAHGTAFGLYNAVTHYTNHVRPYKTADNRLNSIWFGSGARIDQKALNILIDLSKN